MRLPARPGSLPGSLMARIVALQLVSLAVAAGVIVAGIRVQLNHVFTAFEHRALQDRAAAIARSVRPGPAGGVEVSLPAPLADLYAQGSGGFAYAVFDANHRRVASSGGNSGRNGAMTHDTPGQDTPELGARPAYMQRMSGDAGYFAATFPERAGTGGGGPAYWIEIVQSLAHPDVYADDIVRIFLERIVWFVPPIALALLAANGLIVTLALRPVVIASRRAEAIHPHRIDVRLPERGLPTEIAPLVQAVNRALDRLAEGFRAQREFTADVAHDLRTPLAVLRLRADKIAEPGLAAAFGADIDAMSRLTDQLLALAELETFTLPAEASADLRRIALDVVGLLAPGAVASGVEIELIAPEAPVPVRGQADSIARALRNLVENALAVSPRGSLVTIGVEAEGAIRVADQGPGIAEGDRAGIFRRGWRRDRQTAVHGNGGHGLGLAIVRRIVEAHGAEIAVGAASGGGAEFTMRFVRA